MMKHNNFSRCPILLFSGVILSFIVGCCCVRRVFIRLLVHVFHLAAYKRAMILVTRQPVICTPQHSPCPSLRGLLEFGVGQ